MAKPKLRFGFFQVVCENSIYYEAETFVLNPFDTNEPNTVALLLMFFF